MTVDKRDLMSLTAGGRRGHDSREAGGLYRLQRAKNQFSPERNAALLDFSAGRPVSHLCPLEPQGTTLVLVKLLRLCFSVTAAIGNCTSGSLSLHTMALGGLLEKSGSG